MRGIFDIDTESVDSGAARLWRWVLPLAVLLLGFWFIPLAHTCQLRCMPGDMGDARFNDIILEHFYRWVTGQDRSLLSPPFFYPMPGALTFSDNHWGTAWVYSIFRVLGWDRYQAFDLWYLAAYPVNYLVSYSVLRKLRFSPLASSVGAFAFTFPMPVIAKHGHAQLLYRFLVPVGLLCWQRFSETANWRWIGWLALAVVGQFYISIYLGYFMLLLLAAWAVVQWRVDGFGPRRWFKPWRSWRDPEVRRQLVFAGVMLLLAFVAFLCLMYPYLHYAKLYGFRRVPDEIATMLPRPQSYLLADESGIWGGLSTRYLSVPMRGEHQMFFGIGILGLALIGLVRSTSRFRWMAAISVLLLMLLTLSVGGHSIYMLLAKLPGVNSIRAVSRIGLVMALPLALLVAMAIDALRRAPASWRVVGLLLVGLMATESIAMQTVKLDIAQAREHTAQIVAQLPSALPANAIIFVPSGPNAPFFVSELDGMIVGQEVGRPTLNGYSGNLAPGYEPHSDDYPCVQAATRLEGAKRFFADSLKRHLPAGASGAVAIAGVPSCSMADAWREMPLEQSSKVSLRIESIEREANQFLVQVEVLNGTTYALNTSSARVQALHLSWQKLGQTQQIDPTAWMPRIEIGGHGAILPGQTRSVSFHVPATPGDTGRLAISAVLEGRAWLNDYGLRPAFGTLPTEK